MEARIVVTTTNFIQIRLVLLNLQKSENKNKKTFNGLIFVASILDHRSKVHVAPSVAKIGTKIIR